VRVGQRIAKELMARITHAAQIDLRFGDSASELIDVVIGRVASDFSGDRLNLFGQR